MADFILNIANCECFTLTLIAQGTRNENNIIKSTFQASVYEDNRTYDKDTNTV